MVSSGKEERATEQLAEPQGQTWADGEAQTKLGDSGACGPPDPWLSTRGSAPMLTRTHVDAAPHLPPCALGRTPPLTPRHSDLGVRGFREWILSGDSLLGTPAVCPFLRASQRQKPAEPGWPHLRRPEPREPEGWRTQLPPRGHGCHLTPQAQNYLSSPVMEVLKPLSLADSWVSWGPAAAVQAGP